MNEGKSNPYGPNVIDAVERFGIKTDDLPPLQEGGGGGTSGGMDAWQQSVETRLGALGTKLDEQLKWLLIAFAGGFVVLAGLMLGCTIWLSGHVDALGGQIGEMKTAIAVLQSKMPVKP